MTPPWNSSARYGRASVVFPQYVDEVVTRGHYGYSRDAVIRILSRTSHVIDSMAKIKGDSEDVLPTVDDMVKFVTRLSHNLPAIASSQSDTNSPNKPFQAKREDTKKTSSASTSKASVSVLRVFADASISQRWNIRWPNALLFTPASPARRDITHFHIRLLSRNLAVQLWQEHYFQDPQEWVNTDCSGESYKRRKNSTQL